MSDHNFDDEFFGEDEDFEGDNAESEEVGRLLSSDLDDLDSDETEYFTIDDLERGLQSFIYMTGEQGIIHLLTLIGQTIEGHQASCVLAVLIATWQTGGLPDLHNTIHEFGDEFEVMKKYTEWVEEQKLKAEVEALKNSITRSFNKDNSN